MSPPLAALVATVAIGASPSAHLVKLAAPGLSLVDVDRGRGTFYLEYFSEPLSHQGPIRVTTEAEIAALAGRIRSASPSRRFGWSTPGGSRTASSSASGPGPRWGCRSS